MLRWACSAGVRVGYLAAVFSIPVFGCSDPPCQQTCSAGEVCIAGYCRLACVEHSDCASAEVCYRGYCEAGDIRPDLVGDSDSSDGAPGDSNSGDVSPGDSGVGDPLTGDPFVGDPGEPGCGNNFIDNGEYCDGTDLGAITTCIAAGWAGGGPVTCMPTCALVDLTACTGAPGNCNGVGVSGRQQCDGPELRGESCESLGFSGGTLVCTSVCAFDVSGCTFP